MVVRLKPSWVKGYSRLGAAHHGLKQYSEAKDAYQRAVRLDPDNHMLQTTLDRAIGLELQQVKDRKHTFKKVKVDAGVKKSKAGDQGGRKKPALLSFEDE